MLRQTLAISKNKWQLKIHALCSTEHLLICSLILVALISIQPFFIWDYSKYYYVTSTVFMGFCYTLYYYKHALQLRLWVPLILTLLFLSYITLLPKADGGHVKWIFLIPFVSCLLTSTAEVQKKVFLGFSWAFALSLLPGFFQILTLLFNSDQTFQIIPHPLPLFAKNNVFYLYQHGALFINSNSVLLPNQNILPRLCGIWPEPGSVGTICALLIAANQFSMKKINNLLLFIGGLLSFSLAFIILMILGFGYYALIKKQKAKFIAIIIVLLSTWLLFNLQSTPVDKTADKNAPIYKSLNINGVYQPILLGHSLRQKDIFNNRSSDAMKILFHRVLHSDLKTLLFGIASDASIVYGGNDSATWQSVIINYGVIGFALLFSVFFSLMINEFRLKDFTVVSVFVLLFILSFYQRPLIWMPFYFVIFLGGILIAKPHQTNR
jgi:hypothetical protein